MNITKPQVEQIFKTLPIGYYTGRDITCKLTDENGSYFDPMNDEIFVSYPMIQDVCKSIPADQTTENDIRCLLYHEVSHAILTSKEMPITSKYNIFEDERIETLLSNYYLGVNFKQFVKRVNNFKNEKPTSANDMFYQIVRYRVGPQQFVDRVASIIKEYSDINRETEFVSRLYYYTKAIDELYDDIRTYFNEQVDSNSQQNEQQNGQQSGQGKQRSGRSEDDCDEQESEKTNEQTDKQILDASEQYDGADAALSKNEVQVLFETVINKFESVEYQQKINQILSSIKQISKQTGSAINTYSGMFSPRSVVRTDFKWFVQQNRSGHVKAYSKIKLNLFIDCSGSFRRNDLQVNKLLKALTKFERQNKDFSFDLISCGKGQQIREKSNRVQSSTGGTLITADIFEQYKKVQAGDAQNINICLYDGDCTSSGSVENAKNLSVFDNGKSILILDDDNQYYAKKYCKNAKVIISNRYTDELDKNVFDTLSAAIR